MITGPPCAWEAPQQALESADFVLTVNTWVVSLALGISACCTYPSPPAGISAPSSSSLSKAPDTLSPAPGFSPEALSLSPVVFPLPSGEADDAEEAVCLSSSLFLSAAALSTVSLPGHVSYIVILLRDIQPSDLKQKLTLGALADLELSFPIR